MDTAEVIELAPADSCTRDGLVDELYAHGPMLLAAARVITLDNDEAGSSADVMRRPTGPAGLAPVRWHRCCTGGTCCTRRTQDARSGSSSSRYVHREQQRTSRL